jgi:hypothetical protein
MTAQMTAARVALAALYIVPRILALVAGALVIVAAVAIMAPLAVVYIAWEGLHYDG